MPNHTAQPASKVLYPGAVTIRGTVIIGATGAVGTLACKGVSTVVRNSTGNYTITLTDSYYKLAGWHINVMSTTTKQVDVQMYSEDVDGSTPAMIIEFNTASSGAAADPPAGTMFMEFHLSNSDLGIG